MSQNNTLVLIIVLGILARIVLWGLVPVTADAVYHYSIARYISHNWRIPSFEYETGGDAMWYPPAFHLLASFFYTLFGSEKITPLFLSILSLFAFYALLKKFYINLLLPGMILVSFLPTQMYYGAIGYVESLFFLLAPLILYFYFTFLEKNDNRFLFVALLLSSVSFLTHYQGFIPLLAISIHLFFKNHGRCASARRMHPNGVHIVRDHGRSLVRDKKTALLFLTVGLILVSPWYIRNYVVFGNPIWPMFFDAKYPAHEGYHPSKMVNILSLSKWKSLFFEYWIGAPNSGEDFMRNVEIAGKYIPYPNLFFVCWLALVFAFSVLSLYGLYKLLRRDPNKSFFLLIILLSLIPLLLSNFVRMFVFVFPVIILGFSKVLAELNFKLKWVVFSIAFAGLVSPTFAYAFVYNHIVGMYTPFYNMVNEVLPKDAVVCNMMDDVLFNNVNRTVVSVGAIPEYRVTLKCLGDALGNPSETSGCFKKFGVDYVCCTSLRTENIGGMVKEFCDTQEMQDKNPAVEYSSNSVWGRCWKI